MSRGTFWESGRPRLPWRLSGCGAKNDVKYKIAVIPKGLTHQHWQSVHRGGTTRAACWT